MTMACYYWEHGKPYDTAFVERQFLTAAYYFMWPHKEQVRQELASWQRKIESGTYEKEVKIAGAIKDIVNG